MGAPSTSGSKRQGNYKRKHGMSEHPLFRRWCSMVARCYVKSHSGYAKYGGRGIGVCKRWRESFPEFVKDMGNPPHPGATIGRVDNDKDYCKSNCRWETPKQQANNRRSSHLITYKGKTQTLQAWAEETNIQHTTLLYRLRRGWKLDDVFNPIHHKRGGRVRPREDVGD